MLAERMYFDTKSIARCKDVFSMSFAFQEMAEFLDIIPF
jgi:hypothetical protein